MFVTVRQDILLHAKTVLVIFLILAHFFFISLHSCINWCVFMCYDYGKGGIYNDYKCNIARIHFEIAF